MRVGPNARVLRGLGGQAGREERGEGRGESRPTDPSRGGAHLHLGLGRGNGFIPLSGQLADRRAARRAAVKK